MTQKDVVLQHLREHDKLSSMQAFREYGITRLSAVVFELRKDGHAINAGLETCTTRLGRRTQYTSYSLVKEAEHG